MKTSPIKFNGKKVLVFGLGALGGGVATTNWLLDHGARVTVTDVKNTEQLASSVKRVEEHIKRAAADGASYAKTKQRLIWSLGGHSDDLIDAADTVVVNPGVSVHNPYIVRAVKRGIHVCNDGTIFFDAWKKSVIGVTGTRGKTTTATWANHLIGTSVLTGNSTVKPFLAALADSQRSSHAVAELSSFILEFFGRVARAPHIAVITNLYRDHLNRHRTMKEYGRAKANIFIRQTAGDHLILNHDDAWTLYFIGLRPRAHVWRFSMNPLPAGLEGVWVADNILWERVKGREQHVLQLGDFASSWGAHNVANLAAASLAAHLAGVPWSRIQSRIESLPVVPYRQEIVHRDARITVVNDTTATSPEGGIAALRRWGGPTTVLICGGTDRDLDYNEWAREIPAAVRRTNLIFLSGSATKKMRAALGAYGRGIRSYDSLAAAFKAARARAGLYVTSVVLFSPAAKSFELFTDEYDRGQQFNALVKREVGTK